MKPDTLASNWPELIRYEALSTGVVPNMRSSGHAVNKLPVVIACRRLTWRWVARLDEQQYVTELEGRGTLAVMLGKKAEGHIMNIAHDAPHASSHCR